MNKNDFNLYFQRLKNIKWSGRFYKRFFTSPVLYFLCAHYFGVKILEVGSGVGNGILGAFPKQVIGIDINPLLVSFSKGRGLNAKLIDSNGSFPTGDNCFDVCVLDNVIEHISNFEITLEECYRVTHEEGGMIITTPGIIGFSSDFDHKIFFDEEKLKIISDKWILINIFSLPFYFKSYFLSKKIKQYCLCAIYRKNNE